MLGPAILRRGPQAGRNRPCRIPTSGILRPSEEGGVIHPLVEMAGFPGSTEFMDDAPKACLNVSGFSNRRVTRAQFIRRFGASEDNASRPRNPHQAFDLAPIPVPCCSACGGLRVFSLTAEIQVAIRPSSPPKGTMPLFKKSATIR